MASSEPYLFTSESVTEGHPDKVADQISDAVLDAVLAQDAAGRVACETLVKTGMVLLAGEITAKAELDFARIARQTLREIGYTDASYGFDAENCAVLAAIEPQSGDIAMGVDCGGAGDQGLMFGYATNESPELMPWPILLAHRLTRRLAETRRSGLLPMLRPDGKSQVTVEYDAQRRVRRVHTVVVSAQHAPEIEVSELKPLVEEHVIRPVIPEAWWDRSTKVHVNPTGRFVTGGPKGDCGLTGRKIIVDTYGGVGSHGGGCFSGKDPTKVDRSASYMGRYIAKNLVAAGLAERVLIQLAYVIGLEDPVSVHVDTFGTGVVADRVLERQVRAEFPLTPRGIIRHLDLLRPIYKTTAAYGHFGRLEPQFTWERTDRAKELAAIPA
jgi:S-adenosylmethionine synthetase